MLETKQLKYFVVAAECRSFSEAARILYTTQSNVSKVISLLEDSVGYALFARDKNGIVLSSRGEAFYRRALPLLESLELLEKETVDSAKGAVRISSNPSSWFARRFSDFFELHRGENLRYNIHTDTTAQIVQRIRRMEDEAAFVYIFPEHQAQFEYELKRDGLYYEEFRKISGMLYFAPEDSIPEKPPSDASVRAMGLVQAEHDEYALSGKWMFDGKPLSPEPVVTTNSDYIMNIMMKRNGLANISAACFTQYEEGHGPGIPLFRESGLISYGVLRNPKQPPGKAAEALIGYIRDLTAQKTDITEQAERKITEKE